MGGIVFGGDDQAAGVPVNAVDDAGTLLPPDAGQALPAVIQQGVDQGYLCVFPVVLLHQ